MAGAVEGVRVENQGVLASSDAIVLGKGGSIRDSVIIDAGRAGIKSYDGNITIIGNTIINSDGNAIQVGETYKPVADVRIEKNHVNRTAKGHLAIVEGGIKVHASPTNADAAISSVIIRGNDVRLPRRLASGWVSSLDPFYNAVCIETWGNVRAVRISENQTDGGSIGISVNRTASALIANNIVGRSTSHGIEVAQSSRVSVEYNKVEGAGATWAGITVDPSASISNNVRLLNNDVAATVKYGIFLEKAKAVVLAKNHIKVKNGFGLYVKKSLSFQIRSNTFETISALSHQAALAIDGSSSGLIEQNLIQGFEIGLQLLSYESGGQVSNLIITGKCLNCQKTLITNARDGGNIDRRSIWLNGVPLALSWGLTMRAASALRAANLLRV